MTSILLPAIAKFFKPPIIKKKTRRIRLDLRFIFKSLDGNNIVLICQLDKLRFSIPIIVVILDNQTLLEYYYVQFQSTELYIIVMSNINVYVKWHAWYFIVNKYKIDLFLCVTIYW